MRGFFFDRALAIGLLLLACSPAGGSEADDYLTRQGKLCDELLIQWRQANDPQVKDHLGKQLQDAAVRAERPAVVDQLIAGGRLAETEVSVPRRARRVRLHELKVFAGIRTSLDKENGFFNYQDPNGWLIRRLTAQAFEVWTPGHGWLFDGQGRLRNEARPPRRGGQGREWYGAFLPDGRWVTTDLEDWDCTLTFFSRAGQRLQAIPSAELALPGPYRNKRPIIGWGRSDKDGSAWIVNVGSEGGYATVRVGPDGPARVLAGIERWQLCYPRALGPRGWYLELSVPDDAGRIMLTRESAGHGDYVGYPAYHLRTAQDFSLSSVADAHPDGHLPLSLDDLLVPNGNFAFGFWPGQSDVFIGAERLEKAGAPDAVHIVKQNRDEHINDASDGLTEDPRPVVDKTWFYTRSGRFQGWLRARRLADSADGHSMLFRMDDDSRIATLNPKLGVSSVRRFIWPGGKTADAVTLFDDLRLGFFVHDRRLVLASW